MNTISLVFHNAANKINCELMCYIICMSNMSLLLIRLTYSILSLFIITTTITIIHRLPIIQGMDVISRAASTYRKRRYLRFPGYEFFKYE